MDLKDIDFEWLLKKMNTIRKNKPFNYMGVHLAIRVILNKKKIILSNAQITEVIHILESLDDDIKETCKQVYI